MKKAVFGLGLLASLAFVVPAHAVVLHNYDLNGSLTDSKGGPTLVANGGVLGATGYEFNRQQGLTLTGLDIAGGDYTIEIGFYFNSFGGYQKVLDFSGLASDVGLYALGKALNFYPFASGQEGAIVGGQIIDLVLSRNINDLMVTGSINGEVQFKFVDTRNLADSNTLNFFIDDRATRGSESGSGFVDYIRISNSAKVSPVPLPAALPLLLAGVAGLGVMSRRGKRREKA
jgi:hypothetical protein